jgi:hypothetical protein
MGNDSKVFARTATDWQEHDSDCDAKAISESLATTAVAWRIETTTDTIWIECYRNGALVRELVYMRQRWTRRGLPQRFESPALAAWTRRKKLLASPDGYDVLACFLGRNCPPPHARRLIHDQGANQHLYVAPPIVDELTSLAARHDTTPSQILAAAWELGKFKLYERIAPEAQVIESGPTLEEARPGLSGLPSVAHPPRKVAPLDLDNPTARSTVECGFVMTPRVRDEVVRMAMVADRALSWMMREAYLLARSQLV